MCLFVRISYSTFHHRLWLSLTLLTVGWQLPSPNTSVSKNGFVSNLDTVWLVVANINLIAAVAGGDSIGKFHRFHDAELVQNCSGLLTEDNYSLDLALHNNDVAKSINCHATWILQDVGPKLSDESTVSGKYLYLQEHSKSGLLYRIMDYKTCTVHTCFSYLFVYYSCFIIVSVKWHQSLLY